MKKYRVFFNTLKEEKWIQEMADYGWKHIAGDKSSGSQYFFHEDKEKENELFSDEDSKRDRILRIRKMLR